jgi:hypothetical protein
MKLFEFVGEDDLAKAYYDPAKDRIGKREIGDTRKPRLTLMKINKLKKLRSLRQLEALERQDLLAIMYGQPVEEEGGGFGGF